MAAIPFEKSWPRPVVRYYICTGQGLRRMPLKLYRCILSGQALLPQFANKTAQIIETLIWRPSEHSLQIKARITSDLFDDRGGLDLGQAAEAISTIIEDLERKGLGDNVVDIEPILRSQKLARSARVPRALMQQIREDVVGRNKLPIFRIRSS